ncbi:MAG: hypothetical protein IT463_07975 [Planctomycetes bacterium]|nr:hypothetical protein [Planctomycetota bacterium]
MLASDAGGLIVFLLFAAFFIGLVVYGFIHAKKVREAWAGFAGAHGLSYNGAIGATSRPHIQGWYKNVFIDISTITRGSGKNRSTYTVYHASINAPMPAGLLVTKEGLLAKLGQMFGGSDIQVGDREMDAALNIKARDAQGAVTLLRMPPVKRAILYMIARQGDTKWSERNVSFEASGITSTAVQLAANVEDLVYLVATLDAAYAELTGTTAPAAPTRGGQPGAEAVRRASAAAAQEQAQRFSAEAAAATAAAQIMAQAATAQQQAEIRDVRAAHERELAAARAGLDAARQARTGGARPISSDSQRRTRAESEAVGLLADALHKLEVKMAATGAMRAEDVAALHGFAATSYSNAANTAASSRADAFAASSSDVFDSSKPAAFSSGQDAFAASKGGGFAAQTAAFSSGASADAFKSPTAGDAFRAAAAAGNEFQTPAAGGTFAVKPPAAKPADTPAEARTLEELIARLSDSAIFTRDREQILASHRERVFVVRAKVERIDRTFGFDLPDALRDGRTLEGEVPGKGIKLHVRYPASRNAELDRLSPGTELDVQAVMANWDDLFKRATMDAM